MKKIVIVMTILALFSVAYYKINIYDNKKSLLESKFQVNKENINSDGPIDGMDATSVNMKVQDFTLKDLDGNTVSLSDFKGKKIFINFWATWCNYCLIEMPDIKALYEKNKDNDVVILAINLGESREKVKSFIDSKNYKFKVLLDTDQQVGIKYKVSALPTSLFIDKEGNMVKTKLGPMSFEEMTSYIDLLDKK